MKNNTITMKMSLAVSQNNNKNQTTIIQSSNCILGYFSQRHEDIHSGKYPDKVIIQKDTRTPNSSTLYNRQDMETT